MDRKVVLRAAVSLMPGYVEGLWPPAYSATLYTVSCALNPPDLRRSPNYMKKPAQWAGFDVGICLFSRAASSQVFSTQVGLTAVFGMGTGVPPPPSTPTRDSIHTLKGLVKGNIKFFIQTIPRYDRSMPPFKPLPPVMAATLHQKQPDLLTAERSSEKSEPRI